MRIWPFYSSEIGEGLWENAQYLNNQRKAARSEMLIVTEVKVSCSTKRNNFLFYRFFCVCVVEALQRQLISATCSHCCWQCNMWCMLNPYHCILNLDSCDLETTKHTITLSPILHTSPDSLLTDGQGSARTVESEEKHIRPFQRTRQSLRLL